MNDWRCRLAARAFALAVVMVACSSSDPHEAPSPRSCNEVGQDSPCACTDGRMGSQTCEADRTLGSCDCGPALGAGGAGDAAGGSRAAAGTAGAGSASIAGAATGEAGAPSEPGGAAGMPGATGEGGGGNEGGGGPCGVGDVQGCRCDDQVLGHRYCANGAFGDCDCAVFVQDVLIPNCVPKPEVCNQVDDDCDGVIDEQFVCPDATVKNTRPFARGVYLGGRVSSQCSSRLLQRFWPTLAPKYVGDLSCSSDQFVFPEFDDGLYYELGGVYRKTTASERTKLPTPSCSSLDDSSFGFDAEGTLHYLCSGILRRGEGEAIAGSVDSLAAVLGDGRVIATRGGPTLDPQFVVLAPDGSEISHFPPQGMFSGHVFAATRSVSTAGNIAYVGLTRSFQFSGQGPQEILVYAVDESSIFRVVRRFAMPTSFASFVVVSDGTVLARSYSAGDNTVMAYLPNNTSALAWRSTDTPAFDATNDYTLVVGPLTPNLDP